MDYLLFIDTNVLLDHYRAMNDAKLSLLDLIDKNHNVIITTYQVEMEFKKNRQEVIVKSIQELKKPNTAVAIPSFLMEAKAATGMKKGFKEALRQIDVMQKRTRMVLEKPTSADPVYQTAQRLFKNKSDLNLLENDSRALSIRRRAMIRFMRGCPPRKDKEVSIGDAINWEWIIDCAASRKSNVIVASRDSDYGVTYEETTYINDHLLQEFHARVGSRKNLVLTSRLTRAFKMMEMNVSSEQEKEEDAIIMRRRTEQQIANERAIRGFGEALPPIISSLEDFSRELVGEPGAEPRAFGTKEQPQLPESPKDKAVGAPVQPASGPPDLRPDDPLQRQEGRDAQERKEGDANG
jgi:hypothetical protein